VDLPLPFHHSAKVRRVGNARVLPFV
jgi:hypothetical protein